MKNDSLKKKKKNLDSIINELMKEFNSKQWRVVCARFGLDGNTKKTLQQIGNELGVTRERVRQIEQQSLKKLTDIVSHKHSNLIKLAEDHLNSTSGIREDILFLDEINKKSGFAPSKFFAEKLRFLFLAAGIPAYYKEDDDYRAFWFIDKKAEKIFFDFVKEIKKSLKNKNENRALTEKEYTALCPDRSYWHYLSIPKFFAVNVFGDFGLKDWPEIQPKTIRDKAYLVLKKKEKPLHFEEIASHIHLLGIDKKPAHVQTVHNELIKDRRFVLVGRGVYALRECGYEPGTVREVISKLLQKEGPLSSVDVVRLVNQQRFLKENTILLNLQNRKYFKRLEDGSYHIKEA